MERASYMEILKLNKPEWPYIVVGTFFAGVLGIALPAFAILFSEVVSVSTRPEISYQTFVL